MRIYERGKSFGGFRYRVEGEIFSKRLRGRGSSISRERIIKDVKCFRKRS